MKKAVLLLALVSILIPGYSFAAPSHNIHIEWSYSQPSDSRQLSGYHLYKEGIKVCTSNNPAETSMDCVIESENGTYDFTLSSYFTDNSESDQSTPYSFPLSSSPTSPSTTYNLYIEWNYDTYSATGNIVAGYNLYKEGTKICAINNPAATNMTCSFDSGEGTFDFTLTTYFTDASESPHSAPYAYTLSPTAEPELVAVIATNPVSLSGDVPFSVAFDGNGSSGTINSYAWDFGDNKSGSGNQASHTYTTAGSYNATLVVTSSTGATSQSSVTITAKAPPEAVISSSAVTGDTPFIVSFNGTGSTGDIASYAWDFGDNTSGTGSQVSHNYTTAGTYNATLIVTSSTGTTSQKSVTITAKAPPEAVISSSAVTGDTPLTVSFNGTGSSGDIASYAWDFGDNTSGTGSQVSHNYTTAGTYNATLIVTSSTGTTSQTSITITATTPPVPPKAVISSSAVTGNTPLTVSFDGTGSTGDIVSYAWSFGDNSSGTGSQASHNYTTAGTYNATLTVTSPTGTTSQTSVTITATAPPVPPEAVISSSAVTGDAPLMVSFNGTGSTGDIASYAWNFGDNSSGTGSQISHNYTTAGTYNATLTVTSPTGSTGQTSVTITATEPAPPTTTYDLHIEWSFQYSPIEGKELGGYYFYKEGVKICTSSDPNATSMDCSFDSEEGTFQFTLTSYFTDNSESPHSAPYTYSLSPTAEPELVAVIATDPVSLSGDAPFSVSFNGTGSTGNIVSYTWDFGDNTTDSGNQASHTYSSAGTYSAMLVVTSSSGATSQSSVTISATAPTAPLKAVISSSTLTGDAPLKVNFNGTGSTGAVSYLWSFGDGSTSPNSSTVHHFNSAGTYTTTLTVAGATPGQTDQATVTVIVNTPPPVNTAPNAIISSSTAVGEAPFAITFNGSGSSDAEGPINTYSWSFGDGATATGLNTSHTYTVAGTYTASLTVTDGQSGTDTVSTPIIITEPTTSNESPTARLSASSEMGPNPLEVTFSGAESSDPENGNLNYAWNFGDGSSASGMTATHSFTTVGSFDATLTVTDDPGASSSASITITTLESTPSFHIELDDIEIDHNWARVDFAEPFVHPVVVAGPLSNNDSDPSVIRLRNITSTGFEIRLQEWNYLDGTHGLETVSYLVLEKGTHTLDDGTQIEAGTFTASGGATKTVEYTSTFATEPVVMTTQATFNDTNTATSRLKDISTSGFSVSIEEEEQSSRTHGEESIGYIAWEQSNTTIGNMKVIVAKTSKIVKHKWYTIKYGEQLIEIPLFLAAMSPQKGGNTASIRYTNRTDSSVQVKVAEEQSKDREVRHSRETIGYFLFSTSAPGSTSAPEQ